MVTGTVPDVSDREYWEQREQEDRWAEAEIRKAETALRRGHRAGAFNCGSCGRFKPRPSARCDHCGDDPVTHNGDPRELDRAHGYFTEPARRGRRRRVVEAKQSARVPSGPVGDALAARQRADEQLGEVLRGLPKGRDRWQAIRDCLATGMRQTEVARLMRVSPQRIGQMLAEDDCPF